MAIGKPAQLSGRDREWRSLAAFAQLPDDGARLGLVYGRRRQGKTLMLDLLAEATSGLMFTAVEQSSTQNLRMLGEAYARFVGVDHLVTFGGWPEAIEALLKLGVRRAEPTAVVLDEFPYLLDVEPTLASLVQIGIGPTSPAYREGRTRLILCGSALTTMRRLVSGAAPLRGRAALELMVPPFGFREAAEFWRLAADPDLAFRVNALVGGTPAYQAMSGGTPAGGDFDDWVAGGLLNPASAIFREGDVLLYEQAEVSDATLYFSVLAAIASGAARRSEIGGLMSRPDSALAHPLAVLEQLDLIEKVDDALRPRRPVFHIAEPVIRFHQLITRPREAILAAGGAARVWSAVADTVAAKIYGPHLERIAREWTLLHASEESLGGEVTSVAPATVNCRDHGAGHELDVVAVSDLPHQAARVIAIGEVKATAKPMGLEELTRLDHLRSLLPSDRVSGQVKLLCFARRGPSAALAAAAARRADIEIVDLERLYRGD